MKTVMIQPRDIPNIISLVRIALIVPILVLLLNRSFGPALLLFLIAAISDGIDGWLARHYHWRSRLGSLLDPLADKLLQVSIFPVCGWLELIPWWLVAIVIARDLIIVSGALLYHYRFGPFHGEPMLISKLNTVMQMTLIGVIMLDQWLTRSLSVLIVLLTIMVTITTLSSGLLYVVQWWNRAREAARA